MAAAPVRIVVVGGGISGLSAAYHLQEMARQRRVPLACTLVEAAPRLGGKILTEHLEGQVIEGGPDSYLARKPAARQLATHLGLGHRLVGNAPGQATYVLHRGRLEPLPEGMMLVAPTRFGPFLRSRLLSPWGKLRVGLDLVLPRSRGKGDQSLAAFVGRRIGAEAFRRLADPLLAGIYAGDSRALSLLATFPQLRDLEQRHGSLLRGLLAMRRQGRRLGPGSGRPAGSPVHPPAGTGGAGHASMFETLQGGLGELVAAVAAAMPAVTVRLGARAEALTVQPDQGEGQGDGPTGGRYRLVLAGGEAVSADAVVLAAPAYVSADLLDGLSPRAAGHLRAIPYAGVATVVLSYRAGEVGRALNGSGFVVPRDQGHAITACTWVSSKWPHAGRPDRVLLRCYVGRAGDEAAAALPEAALLARVGGELGPLMGITAPPQLARVYRWPRAMPQYQVGHLDRLQAIAAALDPHPGVVLCGAGLRGIGIPDCIAQGEAAARRALDSLAGRSHGAMAAPEEENHRHGQR